MGKIIKKIFKKSKKQKWSLILVIALIGTISFTSIWCFVQFTKENEVRLLTESQLKEIINVSELSTYQAIYNSYCTVHNTENTEKIDYRVAYNSKVDVGIDFSLVNISINDEDKVVTISLPETKVLDVEVDISNLEFLFENKKEDKATISGQAYNACVDDVNEKVKSNSAIYEIAQQNAENACIALVKPFIEQLPTPYELKVVER